MKKIVSLIALFLSFSLYAQNPPVGVEALFGGDRVNFQLTMNRSIQGHFRYLNITTATTPYEQKKGTFNELVMVNSFMYQFHKNVGASVGTQYHFLKGFVPNVAIHFLYVNPQVTFMLMPYLNVMPDRNSENIAIFEYKPRISDNLTLYTHLMGLYNYNLSLSEHDRSFYHLRFGLTYQKFTFGVGTNFEYYGPQKIHENVWGGFLKMTI